MKITAVDHITINMKDVDKTFAFYENVLGFEKKEEVDMGDHVLHLYELPMSIKLELIEYKNPQKVLQTENTDVGIYRHFAVVADDLEACRELCEKAGYGINMYPTYLDQIKKTVMLIKDPNGVEIEVVQG